MSDELKPCPFCGAENARLEGDIDCAFILCGGCGARSAYGRTTERVRQAIASWNIRQPMSGWKDIATAPKDGEMLIWSATHKYYGLFQCDDFIDRNDGREFFNGDAYLSATHWYDFGDGKPMPDAPEVE